MEALVPHADFRCPSWIGRLNARKLNWKAVERSWETWSLLNARGKPNNRRINKRGLVQKKIVLKNVNSIESFKQDSKISKKKKISLEDCEAIASILEDDPWPTSAIVEVKAQERPSRSSRDVVHEESGADEKRGW